jgi:hypothetical protein
MTISCVVDLSSRPEKSWALWPTQGDEKRLGPAFTLYGTVTLSLSSRPERRDLQFSGPFVEMSFDRVVMDLRPVMKSSSVRHPLSIEPLPLSLSSRPKRSGAEGPAVPRTLRGDVISTVRTRISCHAALETPACAAFSKESHMKFANATKLHGIRAPYSPYRRDD